MKRKYVLFLLLSVFVVMSGVVISFRFPVTGQTPPPSYDENYAFDQLNIKARTVNEGNLLAVNAMVDEVFATFSTVVASDVKTRIITSERRYRDNLRGGVTETKIVQAVNGLAIKFNTPAYSKTDVYEVRKLRQALQLFAPQFIGHGRPQEVSRTGFVNQTIVPDMSPSEAVFVLLANDAPKTDKSELPAFRRRKKRAVGGHSFAQGITRVYRKS